MWLLTKVLRDKCEGVKRAYIECGKRCYVWVEPHHYDFWESFKNTFPAWRSNALKYCAHFLDSTACPEFKRIEDLLEWLVETLELPSGFRQLLLIEVTKVAGLRKMLRVL